MEDIEFIENDYKSTTLVKYLENNVPKGWEEFFSDNSEIISEISEGLRERSSEQTIFPPMNCIFKALELTSPKDINVVIFGQDPYPQKGAATGQAFSVGKGNKINGSLRNIMKEIKNCGYRVEESCGDLSCWGRQGVLLLNTALTVREGLADSHLKLWSDFTKLIIDCITTKNKKIVFILWGKKAENYIKYFSKDFDKNNIIITVHPSPLSASRGFFNSKCFLEANKKLSNLGKQEIDWDIKKID